MPQGLAGPSVSEGSALDLPQSRAAVGVANCVIERAPPAARSDRSDVRSPTPANLQSTPALPLRKTHCRTCALLDRCLPAEASTEIVRVFDAIVGRQRRLAKGDVLFQAGNAFRAIYVVRTGSLGTKIYLEDGREQTSGYHIGGDVVGLDGVADDRHACAAVALEEGEVCAVPFERLEALASASVALQRNVRQILAREIDRVRHHALALRGMTAEQRLASFLLDLSERYRRIGHSAKDFVLHLSRAEIGSYLGVKSETVSRILANLHASGAIHLRRRSVKVCDAALLSRLRYRRS